MDLANLSPAAARAHCRGGTADPTAGWAFGYAQANLISVPRDWAWDVLLFAQRNPASCPVLDVTDTGSPRTTLAPEADLRTDLPRYRVWEQGRLVDEPTEITELWRDDLVAFLLGCSFTFETTLVRSGIPLRHVEQGRNVPMYITDRSCRAAGRLRGRLVVSMRPIPGADVATAVRLSAGMPQVHGAPLHVGDPAGLGITDPEHPDFGEAVRAERGDVPVFWACGVTPQAALMDSRPPLAITHAPGHMLVTDIPDSSYQSA